MTFVAVTSQRLDAPPEVGRYFTFAGAELVAAASPELRHPSPAELVAAGVDLGTALAVGTLHGEPCRVVRVEGAARDALFAGGYSARGLRSLFGVVDDATFAAAGLSASLAHFDETTRHCGRCGERLVWKESERGKRCPSCAREVYPHVAPCSIVLVEDRTGDRVLLTRSARFPAGMYGLVAGFLEPGESLEECAAREVREETGVAVDEIHYAGSQPWPFPSQVMVGFVARYAGGELVVDTRELEDARWFPRSAMPKLPPPVSIARRLIDRWLASPKRG
jgi:NAD+ diphosphatase